MCRHIELVPDLKCEKTVVLWGSNTHFIRRWGISQHNTKFLPASQTHGGALGISMLQQRHLVEWWDL